MSTHRVTTPPTKKTARVKRTSDAGGGRKKAAPRAASPAKLLNELRIDVDALHERVERLRQRVA